ncbi:hypothetical protein EJB05_54076, partial [Eragrostis curvula]
MATMEFSSTALLSSARRYGSSSLADSDGDERWTKNKVTSLDKQLGKLKEKYENIQVMAVTDERASSSANLPYLPTEEQGHTEIEASLDK